MEHYKFRGILGTTWNIEIVRKDKKGSNAYLHHVSKWSAKEGILEVRILGPLQFLVVFFIWGIPLIFLDSDSEFFLSRTRNKTKKI